MDIISLLTSQAASPSSGKNPASPQGGPGTDFVQLLASVTEAWKQAEDSLPGAAIAAHAKALPGQRTETVVGAETGQDTADRLPEAPTESLRELGQALRDNLRDSSTAQAGPLRTGHIDPRPAEAREPEAGTPARETPPTDPGFAFNTLAATGVDDRTAEALTQTREAGGNTGPTDALRPDLTPLHRASTGQASAAASIAGAPEPALDALTNLHSDQAPSAKPAAPTLHSTDSATGPASFVPPKPIDNSAVAGLVTPEEPSLAPSPLSWQAVDRQGLPAGQPAGIVEGRSSIAALEQNPAPLGIDTSGAQQHSVNLTAHAAATLELPVTTPQAMPEGDRQPVHGIALTPDAALSDPAQRQPREAKDATAAAPGRAALARAATEPTVPTFSGDARPLTEGPVFPVTSDQQNTAGLSAAATLPTESRAAPVTARTALVESATVAHHPMQPIVTAASPGNDKSAATASGKAGDPGQRVTDSIRDTLAAAPTTMQVDRPVAPATSVQAPISAELPTGPVVDAPGERAMAVDGSRSHAPEAPPLSGPQQASMTGNPASPSPQVTLTHALSTPGWSQQFSQQVLQFAQRGDRHIELRLNPLELGPLSISLRLDEQGAQAHFLSAHASVRAAVEQAIPQLRETLAEQGINLAEAEVGSRDPGNSREQAGQQQGAQGQARSPATANEPATALAGSLLSGEVGVQGAVDTWA